MNFNRIDIIQGGIMFIIIPICMTLTAQDFMVLLFIIPLLFVIIFSIVVHK